MVLQQVHGLVVGYLQEGAVVNFQNLIADLREMGNINKLVISCRSINSRSGRKCLKFYGKLAKVGESSKIYEKLAKVGESARNFTKSRTK